MIPQKRSHADLAVWFSLRDHSYAEIGDIVCLVRLQICSATLREVPWPNSRAVDGMIWDATYAAVYHANGAW